MIKFLSIIGLFCSFLVFSQNFEENYKAAKQSHKEFDYESDVFDKAIKSCPDLSEYPDLLAYKGLSLTFRGEDVLALKYLNLALKNAKTNEQKMICYGALSLIQYSSGEIDEAKDNELKTLKYAIAAKDSYQIIESKFNVLCSQLDKSKDTVKSKKEIINFYNKNKADFNLYDRLSYLLMVYEMTEDENLLKEYKSFREQFVQEIKLQELSTTLTHEVYSGIALMDLYVGNYNSALKYCDSAKIIGKKEGNNRILLDDYYIYKDVYLAKNDLKKALIYSDSISVVEDEIKRVELKSAVDLVKENQLFASVQKQADKKFSLLYCILGVLFISVVSLIVLLYSSKNLRNKLNEKLHNVKEKYNLIWADYQLSTKQLEVTKEELSKQMESNENKKLLRDLSIHLNNNVEDTHRYINMVQEDFITHLEERVPFFNAQENLICFFINQKISHKKIAELLNKTERSVSSYKYRMNAKLKKNKGISLEQFLLEIDSEVNKSSFLVNK